MKPKRKVIPNDRPFGFFTGPERHAMDANPMDHFVNDVFIPFENAPVSIVRFPGDNENLVPELHPFLAEGGDGEILGVILLAHDEDFHSDGP